jgi:predicted nuclease with TOPRIM domain
LLYVQAIAAAEQAAQEAECAAEASEQQLSVQLQEQAAENSRLKEQLKKLNADLLDLRGQLEVQTTQQSMVAARETQHQQQLQEQAAKLKEKAAELEVTAKELQVSQCRAASQAELEAPSPLSCSVLQLVATRVCSSRYISPRGMSNTPSSMATVHGT